MALASSQDFQPAIVFSFSTVRRQVVLGRPTLSFTPRCHTALVVRKHDITILRYLANLFFGPIQFLKSTCGFRNIGCFTGKGYWPFAQSPTWRTRCCNSSDLSPGTCPARLNLPGTAVPADIASRVIKARKPPHHDKVQHLGRRILL